MPFLINVIKVFGVVCIGLGIIYFAENRRKYRAKQKQCGFCGPAGRYIAVIAPDRYLKHGLYVGVSGAYLQMYDGEYPGFIENIEINYCPECGRILRKVKNNADDSI